RVHSGFRLPPEPGEVHHARQRELDAFILQQPALQVLVAAAAHADLPLAVDHALPRHVASVRQRRERIADLAGTAAPREPRDLSVGGYAAGRHRAHHRVDALVKALAAHRSCLRASQSRTAGPVPKSQGRSFSGAMRFVARISSPGTSVPSATTWKATMSWFMRGKG